MERTPQQMRALVAPERIKPHGLFEPDDTFLVPAQPGQQLAALSHDPNIIGIELERLLMMLLCLIQATLFHAHLAQEPVTVRVVLVQHERLLNGFDSLTIRGLRIVRIAKSERLTQGASPPRPSG